MIWIGAQPDFNEMKKKTYRCANVIVTTTNEQTNDKKDVIRTSIMWVVVFAYILHNYSVLMTIERMQISSPKREANLVSNISASAYSQKVQFERECVGEKYDWKGWKNRANSMKLIYILRWRGCARSHCIDWNFH